MNANNRTNQGDGVTLRQAALIAGFGILIMVFTTPFAEFFIYPKLVISGDIEKTAQNIATNQGLFLVGFFCYLITALCDILVAWALYVLLAPVNRSLSLLAAWFRLIYAAIFSFALFKLVTVFHIAKNPDYVTVFGSEQLHAQIKILLSSFRYEWAMGMLLFGIHLILLGILVYRSGFIPRIMGILLAIAGVGYVIYELGPYLYPNAGLGLITITFFGELIFMLWLLVRGWKIPEPVVARESAPL